MSRIVYIPIIKMADAELRGVEHLSNEVKDRITPVFELTRSRKTKKSIEGDINRRLAKLFDIYGGRRFILDITSDPNLVNTQLEKLQDSKDGYRNWISFIVSLKARFPHIIPVVQISDENVETEAQMYELIKKEIRSMDAEFEKIVYRFKIDYEYLEKDLEVITSNLSAHSKLICLIDGEFIPQNRAPIYATQVMKILEVLRGINPNAIVVSATSFPKNPTEYGYEETGQMRLEESFLYEALTDTVEDMQIIFGDYATLNPVIVERAGGRGWVPRIDMPITKSVFYYRSRKAEAEATYINAYVRAAELMVGDKRYLAAKKEIKKCWGISQIESAASGEPQGLSPSFWISVRMNIHLTNTAGRLMG